MSSPTIGKEGFDTPTTISEEVLESLSVTYSSLNATVGVEVSPWKGGTFIIRDPKTKLVVALKEGVWRLFDGIYQHGGGSHWRCVENKYMWLGFYNVALRHISRAQ